MAKKPKHWIKKMKADNKILRADNKRLKKRVNELVRKDKVKGASDNGYKKKYQTLFGIELFTKT